MALQNPVETLIGAGVLFVAAGFGVYAMQANNVSGPSGSYSVYALFSSADGLASGTDVRIAGVKVGAVSGLELDPQTYRARVRLAVRDGIELPDDTIAKIDSEGILGGVYVSLEPGGGFDMIPPDGEVQYTQGAVSLTDLLVKFGGSGGGSSSDAE